MAVERGDLVRGYEVAKGEYVQLTDEELDSLEAEANSAIELREFIPLSKVDPVYYEHSYYLAPDQGGEKPYRLLADAMEKVGRVALAEMVSHNKENLVLIRAANGGLVMQTMFYADEVRDFSAVPRAEGERLTPEEFKLAAGLVEKLSSEEFQPEAYQDEHRARVLAMLDEKQKGQEISVAPRVLPRGQVIDIYEALKRSLATAKPRARSAARRPGVKRRSPNPCRRAVFRSLLGSRRSTV